MKSTISWVRRGQRLIRMVSELHRLGYQRLRIFPYEYPLAWRLIIAPRDHLSVLNGAHFLSDESRWPRYSSSQESAFFDWPDAQADSARQLADKFVARFPEVCEAGRGRDWEYAGWLAELLGTLEAGGRMPIVIAEWLDASPHGLTYLPIRDYAVSFGEPGALIADFPLPPPGDAQEPNDGETEYKSGGGSFAAAVQLAASPNYLGSPEVVSELAGELFQVAVAAQQQEASFQDVSAACDKIALAVSDDAAGYTRMPSWHTEEALGNALIATLNLDPEYYAGDNLRYITHEAMTGVNKKIGELLKGYLEDDSAEWERDALPALNELHQFVVTVLMGTNEVLTPGKVLADFRWHATTG